jgi:hypothetical protein
MMFVSARRFFRLALVACIAYPGAQSAFGQVFSQQRSVAPPAGQTAPGRAIAPNQTFASGARGDQNRMLQGSVIIGSAVTLQGGANFGTVRDFVLSDSGCVEYAVIAAGNGLVAVPWGNGSFDVGRRAFALNFGGDRIRDMPHIRDISELRDAGVQQRVQTFYRGNHNGPMNGQQPQQRGAENQQRGAATQPQNAQPEHGATTRGAAPQNTERAGNTANNKGGNERHEK